MNLFAGQFAQLIGSHPQNLIQLKVIGSHPQNFLAALITQKSVCPYAWNALPSKQQHAAEFLTNSSIGFCLGKTTHLPFHCGAAWFHCSTQLPPCLIPQALHLPPARCPPLADCGMVGDIFKSPICYHSDGTGIAEVPCSA